MDEKSDGQQNGQKNKMQFIGLNIAMVFKRIDELIVPNEKGCVFMNKG